MFVYTYEWMKNILDPTSTPKTHALTESNRAVSMLLINEKLVKVLGIYIYHGGR